MQNVLHGVISRENNTTPEQPSVLTQKWNAYEKCKGTDIQCQDQLLEALQQTVSSVSIKPKKMYIAFVRKTNFVEIVIRKSNITLFLNMKKDSLSDPSNLTRDVSQVGHWGSGNYEFIVKESADIGYAVSLIRQSYDKN
ncbi:MAG TPA: DUF5655 domain-containing protein [Candidatus Nitrosopolaris sp.]|nr:DUF5655 domain-containing protein [Candidatus Nitrosopolaris sp.]